MYHDCLFFLHRIFHVIRDAALPFVIVIANKHVAIVLVNISITTA